MGLEGLDDIWLDSGRGVKKIQDFEVRWCERTKS